MRFIKNDGGRHSAGFSGTTGDCVTRAIAIATQQPYRVVYDALNELAQDERTGKRKRGRSSSRTGVYRRTYDKYLLSLGWKWTPTMHIGSGCKVHLVDGELPMVRLIVSVSRHLTVVLDGVIHDTHDSQRRTVWYGPDGKVTRVSNRCVYGYWSKDGE